MRNLLIVVAVLSLTGCANLSMRQQNAAMGAGLGGVAGAKMMIGNQSMPATLALGIGTTLWIETRKNVELEKNEIFYPYRSNVMYF